MENDNVKEVKNELRKKYKLVRSELSPEQKRSLDDTICALTVSLASFRFADTVLMYAPMGSEIDVMPIARHALESGKKVAFPRSNPTSHTMDFKYVSDLDELEVGEYSIREPSETAESVKDFSRSVCIVPGIVFDRSGYRVGYGKGFYDRFLGKYCETKLGLVYSDLILDRVPRGRFDRHVDILVCEKGVRIANQE